MAWLLSSVVKLLYYCPFAGGGIVDYAFAQAAALAQAGTDLTFLTVRTSAPRNNAFQTLPILEDETQPIPGWGRLVRRIRRARLIYENILRLRELIAREQLRYVLFGSYTEYAAPFWARLLTHCPDRTVRFAAMLHDPFRNYVVGPHWWHRKSVRDGYSFLRDVFVHEPIDPAEAGIPPHVRVSVVPHGPLDFPAPGESREDVRRRLGIPGGAKLLLSFGNIRDGKNLDLVIRSMKAYEGLWLLVAGREAGGVQRPLEYYRHLAESSGVGDRCRWFCDFIAAERVGDFFLAADLILLTYSRSFRSASGVLNAAVQFRKPCLASSGQGPLRTQVQRYRLGAWVEPDDEAAIGAGLGAFLRGFEEPWWNEYLKENSWRRNAELVLKGMCSQ